MTLTTPDSFSECSNPTISKHHERCGRSIPVIACNHILCLVHRHWLVYSVDMEFPVLAFGKFGGHGVRETDFFSSSFSKSSPKNNSFRCNQTTWMKTLQGLAMGIQCFGGELPFFFISGRLLKKIGHIHAMSLVLIGFGVRFLLYSVLSNPWWVLPIELLNGVTFGLFYSTMTSYASIVAPTGTEATLQVRWFNHLTICDFRGLNQRK